MTGEMKVRIDIQDMRYHAEMAMYAEREKRGDGRIPIRYELLNEIANYIDRTRLMVALLIEAGNKLDNNVKLMHWANPQRNDWPRLAAEWEESEK